MTSRRCVQLLSGEAGPDTRVVVETVPARLEVECSSDALAARLAGTLQDHYDHAPETGDAPDRVVRLHLTVGDPLSRTPPTDTAWRDVNTRQPPAGVVEGLTRPGLAHMHVQTWLPAEPSDTDGGAMWATRAGSWIVASATTGDEPAAMHGVVVPADHDVPGRRAPALRDLVASAFNREWRRIGFFVMHCSAVIDPDGAGWVFPAFSGGGKTAMVLATVRNGWRLVADDKLILRREPSPAGTTVRGYPMQRYLNLTQDVADRYPDLAFLREQTDSPTWPKVRIDMARVGLGDGLAPQMTPVHVRFPAVADTPASRLEPLSVSAAFELLLEQSVVSLEPAFAREQLEMLSVLAGQCSTARLHGGADVHTDPAAFVRWLANG